MADLLSSILINGQEIKNRLVFAPVVMFGLSNTEGTVTEENINHYDEMSRGEAGLIVVEATCISKHGRLNKKQLGIWNDSFIEGLSKIAEVIHKNGSKAIIQIHHAGQGTDINSTDNENIFAPSPYVHRDGRNIREITLDEIETCIKDYARAAKRAYKAGFDGVEIHGAHGYIISQFLTPDVNIRKDEYGKNKELFVLRVINTVKEAVPKNFITGIRLGVNEPDLSRGIYYAQCCEQARVDYLSISSNFANNIPDDMATIDENFSWITNLGMIVKRHVKIPVISVFGINNPIEADKIIRDNNSDLVASARGLLCDANWIEKFKYKADVNPCLKCKTCAFRDITKECPARQKLRNLKK